MSKGLIWQDDENIIDVVYQTIYGLPVKEAIQVVKKYQEKQLIPIEWLKRYELAKGQEVRLQDAINKWEKENGK